MTHITSTVYLTYNNNHKLFLHLCIKENLLYCKVLGMRCEKDVKTDRFP